MNGVINILKPPGMTSNDVVVRLRKILNTKKIGHTGTLDPLASGVLPVCVGRATKIADYIMQESKEYIGEFTFGIKTDTQDSMGKVIATSNKCVDINSLKGVLGEFVGCIDQTPSKYSAIKIDGQKAYNLARKNIEVNLPKRSIMVYNIDILYYKANSYLLKIACSKGTYIRALCEDIASRLQNVAYLSFLLRTKTCGFNIENSYTLKEIEECTQKEDLSCLIPIDKALDFMPSIILEDYLFKIVTTGTPIDLEKAPLQISDATNYKVYCNNIFVGIGTKTENFLKIISMIYINENVN